MAKKTTGKSRKIDRPKKASGVDSATLLSAASFVKAAGSIENAKMALEILAKVQGE